MNRLVKIETAILAKRKGFDMPVRHFRVGQQTKIMSNQGVANWNDMNVTNALSIPTNDELHNWLRSDKNILVLPSFDDGALVYYYFIHTDVTKKFSNRICSLPYSGSNYLNVLEKGLIEALNLLDDVEEEPVEDVYYEFTVKMGGWGPNPNEAWEACKENFDIDEQDLPPHEIVD